MTEHQHYEELAVGAWGRVLGVGASKQDCPSREWLVGLTDRDQAAMKARLDRLAATGFLKAPDNFRMLSGDGSPVIFEVKHVGQNLRLYVTKGHRVYIATHGGIKPKKNQVASEVAKARRILREYER